MIEMLISGLSDREAGYITTYAKDLTGKLSDEKLEVFCCAVPAACEAVSKKIDLLCIDITVRGALKMVEYFRQNNKTAYIILIADIQMSPVYYMKPAIRAESLLLKPLDEQTVYKVLKEAVSELVGRYQKPEGEVFVIDNQEGRTLVEYDNIYFFEARNKKIYVNLGYREYGFYSTVDKLHEELGRWFLRCHRGFLVNRRKIEKIMFSQNLILLKNQFEIPISRSFRSTLKQINSGEKEKEV